MNSNIREVWNMFKVNPIKDGHFRGCSQMGGQKSPHSLTSVTHILQWCRLVHLYLTQRRSNKYKNHVTHPLISADISVFHRKSGNFVISRNRDKDCILAQNSSFFLNSLESLNIFLINLVIILMMSTKMVTPCLLKITVFSNNDYGVIIHVDDVTSKIPYHVIQIIL